MSAVDTVNYRDTPNWGEVVFARTGGVQRVVNAAGGSAMSQAIAAVGYGGEIAFMGWFDQDAAAPPFLYLMMKGASICGTAVDSAAAYADLLAAIDASGLKPPIDKVFP